MKVFKKDYGKSPDYVRLSAARGLGPPPVVWEAVEDSAFFLDLVKRRPALLREINERVDGMRSKMWHSGEGMMTRGFVTVAYCWTFMENSDARRFQRWFDGWLELHKVPE